MSLKPEPKKTPLATRKRKCLNCEKTFKSIGPHNRICPKCSKLRMYHHNDGLGEIGFPVSAYSKSGKY